MSGSSWGQICLDSTLPLSTRRQRKDPPHGVLRTSWTVTVADAAVAENLQKPHEMREAKCVGPVSLRAIMGIIAGSG